MSEYFTVNLYSEQGDGCDCLFSFETLEEAQACIQASLASSKNREEWHQAVNLDSYKYFPEVVEVWNYRKSQWDGMILEIHKETHDSGKTFALP